MAIGAAEGEGVIIVYVVTCLLLLNGAVFETFGVIEAFGLARRTISFTLG